jgi:phage terminase small subunit
VLMEGELTPQQHNLVKNLVKGMNLQQAAIAAGYSPKNASISANQALKGIRKKMPQLLDKRGLTDSALIRKYLKPALEANETKFFQKDGEVKETHDVINWDARLRALDMTFKLKGSYSPVEVESHHIHEISLIEELAAKKSLEKIQALASQCETPILAEHVGLPENS